MVAPMSAAVQDALPGIEAHPHARAVLTPALGAQGRPSHAYLFHGPAGTGKRALARAFAAELLTAGSADPAAVRERVQRGAHPDLTWVTPSGAAEMLVADVEGPVIAAATRTPFESARRVFVIESVETMNEQAANRMLKTLEEPAAFVHLVLLTDRPQDVLATIASRCQHVRFDPRPSAETAARLGVVGGVGPETALACARLAQGDASLAAWLSGADGGLLRDRAEAFVRATIAGTTATRPWAALLDAARAGGQGAAEDTRNAAAEYLELLPAKERKRHEREALEASRRVERRARTATLDLALGLGELWLRDLLCLREGAGELVLAVDRSEQLQADSAREGCNTGALRGALELVADTRLSLSLNVSEELALEALAYRLEALLAR
jgi:DNA polymerase-3 subunit delta'